MKSSASGAAKGDVIAEGGNKEALFIRTGFLRPSRRQRLPPPLAFSPRHARDNNIFKWKIFLHKQNSVVQHFAWNSAGLHTVVRYEIIQNVSKFQFHLVHTSWRMLLGEAVSRTDMFPSDSWPKMIGEHQIYRLSRIGTLRNGSYISRMAGKCWIKCCNAAFARCLSEANRNFFFALSIK